VGGAHRQAWIRSTTEDGRLIGPSNALLLHPEVMAKLLEFQVAESTNTSLSPSVREVVIIVLGADYGADYALYAHASVARTAGLANDHVVALSGGNISEGLGEHEKLAARLTYGRATRYADVGITRLMRTPFLCRPPLGFGFVELAARPPSHWVVTLVDSSRVDVRADANPDLHRHPE
jgi:hypothetical protein